MAECDQEIFVASVANGEVEDISLEDILFFCTGLDRIPPYGLETSIEVQFDENVKLAKSKTCGFTLTLPMNNIDFSIKCALRFGGGYGEV